MNFMMVQDFFEPKKEYILQKQEKSREPTYPIKPVESK